MIRAVLADGAEVALDGRYGETPEDLHAHLTADSLTGSAVPLANVELVTASGETVRYSDVNAFLAATEQF